MSKKKTRKHLRTLLHAIPDAQIHRRSYAACGHLCALPEFQNAQIIMLFVSLHKEIDTSLALLTAMDMGKKVVVPRVIWETKGMVPVVIETLNFEMVMARCGVREPAGGEVISPKDIDLVVTPGLGFDLLGNRLGRGSGFYDRFLEGLDAVRCAIAFEDQVLDEIPTQSFDQLMDILVTESGSRRFSRTDHP